MDFHPKSHPPKALITGIHGFTGEYLSRELEAAGYEVFGLIHGNGSDDPSIFAGDLEDKLALKKIVEEVEPDVVAHLAAVSFVAHDDVDAIYRVNILGTRNLLQALDASKKPLHKVLIASSANVYGNAKEMPITESTPYNPANDYAVSKIAMEEMAKLWFDRLPIVISRPFNYTGVGQAGHFLIPKIVDHFKRKEKVIQLGNIDVERDFSDVRDIVRLYRGVIEKAIPGQAFNICSGRSISLKEIITELAKIAGYEIKVQINDDFVRANEIKRLVGSDEKLRSALSDQNSISIKETLSWMYNAP